jgi:hypothetical protein
MAARAASGHLRPPHVELSYFSTGKSYEENADCEFLMIIINIFLYTGRIIKCLNNEEELWNQKLRLTLSRKKLQRLGIF